jgi:signal transduction histidine kinase
MEVAVVSEDSELIRLCAESLREIPGCRWSVCSSAAGGAAGADLHIWDVRPGFAPPPGALSPARHLFLVERRHVAAFRAQAGGNSVGILLKPVTRANLSAFLGLAAAARQDRLSAAASLLEDRDEILQCLIVANLKLQEYDQDRTNFLSRALHDFRAPLTALSGYCGLLLSGPLGPLNASQTEVVRRMQHSARRLSRMASGMFELSVGQRPERRAELRPGDIRDPLGQALHEVAPLAAEKGISVGASVARPETALLFNAGQIEQTLLNILDNACKFTPKGGVIEVRGYPWFWDRRISSLQPAQGEERRVAASRRPNSYRIDIRDSGAPIPEERLQSIFEEYTSYSGGKDRSGAGLGLAICRMLAARHEGRIWAENTPAGPMFSLVLPACYSTTAAHGAAEDVEAPLTFEEVY